MVAIYQLALLVLKYGILAIVIGVRWAEAVGGAGFQVSPIGSTEYHLYLSSSRSFPFSTWAVVQCDPNQVDVGCLWRIRDLQEGAFQVNAF